MTDDTTAVEGPKPIVYGVASALSPMVRRIVAANPGMMTGPGTNTYLVGIDEIAVIDPGPDDAAHLDAIAGCGGDRIRWILLTHTHEDHSPGAAGLKKRTGAEILAFDPGEGRGKVAPRRHAGRRRRHRGHRVPPHGPPHPGPRLQPPLLPAQRGADAVHGRPHHAGVDGGHQPARRRHGRVPGLARAAQVDPPAAQGHRPRARPRDRRPPGRRRRHHRPPARP